MVTRAHPHHSHIPHRHPHNDRLQHQHRHHRRIHVSRRCHRGCHDQHQRSHHHHPHITSIIRIDDPTKQSRTYRQRVRMTMQMSQGETRIYQTRRTIVETIREARKVSRQTSTVWVVVVGWVVMVHANFQPLINSFLSFLYQIMRASTSDSRRCKTFSSNRKLMVRAEFVIHLTL